MELSNNGLGFKVSKEVDEQASRLIIKKLQELKDVDADFYENIAR